MKYLILLAVLLYSCGSHDEPGTAQQKTTAKVTRQLNLTILLDLSDRIDPKATPDKPEHYERDSALISYFTDYFLGQMSADGAYMANGKMRVIFHPNPQDLSIN